MPAIPPPTTMTAPVFGFKSFFPIVNIHSISESVTESPIAKALVHVLIRKCSSAPCCTESG